MFILVYNWLDNDKIIYCVNKHKGYNIYDLQKEKVYEIQDEHSYINIFIGENQTIYSNVFDNDKEIINQIKQIELNYDEKTDKYNIKSSKILIDSGKYKYMRYLPNILDISDDKKQLYIIERPSSSSTSTDGVGLGTYDIETGEHKDFLNIKLWCDEIGKRDEIEEKTLDGKIEKDYGLKDKFLSKKDFKQDSIQKVQGLEPILKYKENISISPFSNNEIVINQGSGRDMFSNKKVVLYSDIFGYTDKVLPISKGLVTQTPVFSDDGRYIYYSGQKEVLPKKNEDFNQELYKRKDNIYKYDRFTDTTSKLTDKNLGDINPIPLSKDKLAFFRIEEKSYKKDKNEITASLILLDGKDEKILSDNMRLHLRQGKQSSGFNYYGYTSTTKMIDISN